MSPGRCLTAKCFRNQKQESQNAAVRGIPTYAWPLFQKGGDNRAENKWARLFPRCRVKSQAGFGNSSDLLSVFSTSWARMPPECQDGAWRDFFPHGRGAAEQWSWLELWPQIRISAKLDEVAFLGAKMGWGHGDLHFILVGGLEHLDDFSIYCEFYHPNRRAYFSEG